MSAARLAVKDWPISRLKPYAQNARLHSDAQVEQLAASMKEFGWTAPILADEDGNVIAGHGRLLAAAKIPFDKVPVIVAKGWTEEQKRAYRIADNKLALNATWDENLLALEVADLTGAGFDTALVGFDTKELVSFAAGGAREEEPGIEYQEKYAVLVECRNETEQRETFEKLTGGGYACRVLVN